jgi:hypothetical protein
MRDTVRRDQLTLFGEVIEVAITRDLVAAGGVAGTA